MKTNHQTAKQKKAPLFLVAEVAKGISSINSEESIETIRDYFKSKTASGYKSLQSMTIGFSLSNGDRM